MIRSRIPPPPAPEPCPEPLRRILVKAMSPDPELRYQSAADIAAEFLRRNRTYRAEHTQMQQRIADGAVAKNAAEAAFARRWGLSFRHGTE